MKKFYLTVFFLTLFVSVWAKIGKFRAVFTDNPSYSIEIQWSRDTWKHKVYFYFDTEENYKKNKTLGNKITVCNKRFYMGMWHYFVRLKDLKPGTVYYFQVKTQNEQSEVYWIKTLPENPKKLSIIAGGDSRKRAFVEIPSDFKFNRRILRKKANLAVAKLQPDFVIFDGDFVLSGKPALWKHWLEDWQLTIADNHRLIPLVIIQGNHEQDIDVHNIFDIPQKAYYNMLIGENFMEIFALNTQYSDNCLTKQTRWFDEKLKMSKALWKIVAYHKPMLPHYSGKHKRTYLIEQWAFPIFEHHVQLVLEGDTHVCKWTYPIRPDSTADSYFVRDDRKGTVYVGEGTWGAPVRKTDQTFEWTRDAAAVNQFKLIFVFPDKMEIRTILYENAKKIKQNDYNNRFSLPEGVKLWEPPNGSVLVVKQ